MKDWTADENGRSNSSEMFIVIVTHVEDLIRSSGSQIVNGNIRGVAGLIVAQLAHKFLMEPNIGKYDEIQRD